MFSNDIIKIYYFLPLRCKSKVTWSDLANGNYHFFCYNLVPCISPFKRIMKCTFSLSKYINCRQFKQKKFTKWSQNNFRKSPAITPDICQMKDFSTPGFVLNLWNDLEGLKVTKVIIITPKRKLIRVGISDRADDIQKFNTTTPLSPV